MNRSSWKRSGCLVGAAIAVCACTTSPRQEGQWIDPALGNQSRLLRGEKVLVACDAYDVTVRQLCQDQLSRELAARGATPVTAPAGTVLLTDRELDGQLLAGAAALGAKAVFTMTMTPAASSAGSGVSLGIGGFSFGRGSGAGVGLSVPVGGQREDTGFAANGRVTDVGRRQLVWTTTAVAPPSSDLPAQFNMLTRSVLDSAQGAGLL